MRLSFFHAGERLIPEHPPFANSGLYPDPLARERADTEACRREQESTGPSNSQKREKENEEFLDWGSPKPSLTRNPSPTKKHPASHYCPPKVKARLLPTTFNPLESFHDSLLKQLHSAMRSTQHLESKPWKTHLKEEMITGLGQRGSSKLFSASEDSSAQGEVIHYDLPSRGIILSPRGRF
ncbi:hypothetical protein KSP39_PZI009557 [Platanthera zijinensis]|uniref:Uncharacterized protein n=1 Tax=Platanthera zijinensis TaxID=2320716 RepID=A0AAP0BMK1_9ASPA